MLPHSLLFWPVCDKLQPLTNKKRWDIFISELFSSILGKVGFRKQEAKTHAATMAIKSAFGRTLGKNKIRIYSPNSIDKNIEIGIVRFFICFFSVCGFFVCYPRSL